MLIEYLAPLDSPCMRLLGVGHNSRPLMIKTNIDHVADCNYSVDWFLIALLTRPSPSSQGTFPSHCSEPSFLQVQTPLTRSQLDLS